MNLARAFCLAALLTNATPALADAAGYSTLEPAVAGPDVAITAVSRQPNLAACRWQAFGPLSENYVRSGGQLYRRGTEDDKMVRISLEGQPLKILTVDQEG